MNVNNTSSRLGIQKVGNTTASKILTGRGEEEERGRTYKQSLDELFGCKCVLMSGDQSFSILIQILIPELWGTDVSRHRTDVIMHLFSLMDISSPGNDAIDPLLPL